VKSRGDWKRILPGLVISLIALVVVFYFADFGQVMDALRLADFRLVFFVALLTLVWLGIRSVLWRTLLCEEATFSQVFLTVNEGYLINNVLPLRLGEVARSFLLSRKAGLGFWRVFSTILIERSLDLMMAAGVLLVSLPFVVDVSWALQAALGAGSLVLVGLGMFFLAARNPDWVIHQFEKVTHRWESISRAGSKQLRTFLSGFAVLTDGKRFARTMIWVLLNWAIAVLQYYYLVKAFYPDAQLIWGTFTLGVAALGAAAPSSPGALGVLEASIVGALAVFGLDASTALAAAITGHAINYLITGIIGTYALVQDGIQITRVGDFYQQLKDITPEEKA
jgi:hypothetical protein